VALAGGGLMPLYDFDCSACDTTFTDLRCKVEARADMKCPVCEGPMVQHFVPSNIRLVGATPSKPIFVQGINQTFDDNASYRNYLRDHPEVKIVDGSDKDFKRIKERSTNDANRMAKKAGYSDIDHMRRERKKEAAKKQQLGG
jgi:putative FmdB family regulatory protein